MFSEILTSLLILTATTSNSLVNANCNNFNVNSKSDDNNISLNDIVYIPPPSIDYYAKINEFGTGLVDNSYRYFYINCVIECDFSVTIELYINGVSNFFDISVSDYTGVFYFYSNGNSSDDTSYIKYGLDFNGINVGSNEFYFKFYVNSGDYQDIYYTLSDTKSFNVSSSISDSINIYDIGTGFKNEIERYFYIRYTNESVTSMYVKLYINDVDACPNDELYLSDYSTNQVSYFYSSNNDSDTLNDEFAYYNLSFQGIENGTNTYYFKVFGSSGNLVATSEKKTFSVDKYAFSYVKPTLTYTNTSITVPSFKILGNSYTYTIKYYLDSTLKNTSTAFIDSAGGSAMTTAYTFSGLSNGTQYIVKVEMYQGSTLLDSFTETISTIDSSYAFWTFNGSELGESYFTITDSKIIYLGAVVRTTFAPLYAQLIVNNVESSWNSVSLETSNMTINSIDYKYFGSSYTLNIESQTLSPGTKYDVVVKYASDSSGSNVVFTSDILNFKTLDKNTNKAICSDFNITKTDTSITVDSFNLYSNFSDIKVEYYLNDELKETKNLTGTSGSYSYQDFTYTYSFSGTGISFSDLKSGTYNFYIKLYNGSTLVYTSSKSSVVVGQEAITISTFDFSNISTNSFILNIGFSANYLPINLLVYVNDNLYVSKTYNESNKHSYNDSITINNLKINTAYSVKLVITDSNNNTKELIKSVNTASSNVEVIDIGGLCFTILTMPFAFISQAFNLTLFSGTAYAINIGDVIMFIISIFILIYIVKLILGMIK